MTRSGDGWIRPRRGVSVWDRSPFDYRGEAWAEMHPTAYGAPEVRYLMEDHIDGVLTVATLRDGARDEDNGSVLVSVEWSDEAYGVPHREITLLREHGETVWALLLPWVYRVTALRGQDIVAKEWRYR